MKTIIRTLILALTCSIATSSLLAQTHKEKVARAINLAGKQRMLTQKMTKEVLFALDGPEFSANWEHAQKTSDLFDKTLYGLINGDDDLGLTATKARAVVRQLNKVGELWKPFQANFQTIIDSKAATPDQLATLTQDNLPLLSAMNKAVKLYEREFNRARTGSDGGLAVTINLSGKQRMLSQKMTKELLQLSDASTAEEAKLALFDTKDLFDRTLKGLQYGDADLELDAAINTPEIESQLGVVSGIWSSYAPMLQQAITEGYSSLSVDTLNAIESMNLELLKEMNKAVGMYEKLSS